MKQLTSLLWKEWCEVRIFLAIGLFVFLGLPLIGALEDRWSHLELLSSLWVFALGGLLSVIIAVGVVVRDLNGRLEEFWRSRPVSTARWLIVKYIVGLAVVVTTLALPLVVQMMVNRRDAWKSPDDAGLLLLWHPYFWAAAYSLSFAAASLIRRGAHAAMLSIAMLLLLYFLPSILPPIGFLSLARVMDPDHISTSGQIAFVMGMLGLTGAGLLVSLAAAYRDWRIESDRKMIYWSIGGALLILFSSAVFQVATNMPLLARQKLPQNWRMATFSGPGIIQSNSYFGTKVPETFLCRVRTTASGIDVQPIKGANRFLPSAYYAASQTQHPEIIYEIQGEFNRETQQAYLKLVTINLAGNEFKSSVKPFPELNSRDVIGQFLFAWHDRLYTMGKVLATFDISDSESPRLISTAPSDWVPPWNDPRSSKFFDWRLDDDPPSVTIALPQIPDLPARQRLEIAMRLWQVGLVDDVLVRSRRGHFSTYQLDSLTETTATFNLRGRYDSTPVEELFGASINAYTMTGGGGMLYVASRQFTNSSMIGAFDVSDARPRLVGHFAIPEEGVTSLALLDDGRLLAASDKHVYLLGPPPGPK